MGKFLLVVKVLFILALSVTALLGLTPDEFSLENIVNLLLMLLVYQYVLPEYEYSNGDSKTLIKANKLIDTVLLVTFTCAFTIYVLKIILSF